jgi:hypothetical protein
MGYGVTGNANVIRPVCSLVSHAHRVLLSQGRLYVFTNFICFYSNVFGICKKIVLPIRVSPTSSVAMGARRLGGVLPEPCEGIEQGRGLGACRRSLASGSARMRAYFQTPSKSCTAGGRTSSPPSCVEMKRIKQSPSGGGSAGAAPFFTSWCVCVCVCLCVCGVLSVSPCNFNPIAVSISLISNYARLFAEPESRDTSPRNSSLLSSTVSDGGPVSEDFGTESEEPAAWDTGQRPKLLRSFWVRYLCQEGMMPYTLNLRDCRWKALETQGRNLSPSNTLQQGPFQAV